MTFSPLANMSRRIPDGGRRSPRNSRVTGLGIHHNAGIDSYGEASNPRREVSANYWIANDGTLIPNVDEEFRAWTSGAAGYPAGANADHRNITVEVSNSQIGGEWRISDAAFYTLVALIADVYRRYGLGTVTRGANQGVGIHKDWVPTSCPGPYIEGNLGTIISSANGKVGTPVTTPQPATGDIEALAAAVLRGEYGNGADRQARLGALYNQVQTRVNQLLAGGGAAPAPARPSLDAVADAVLRGEYGDGDERRRRLGNDYAAVQALVNQKLGLQPVIPRPENGADIEALARAVIRGDYGNGPARQAKLGALYPQVQARVNQILGF